MDKVRIDKWLWAVRFYKSRTLASEACDSGKVKQDGDSLKASKLISVGNTITIRHNYTTKIIRVEKVIDKRLSAALVQDCYTDLSPPDEETTRLTSVFHRSMGVRDKGAGRPTKKDRREIDKWSDLDEDE